MSNMTPDMYNNNSNNTETKYLDMTNHGHNICTKSENAHDSEMSSKNVYEGSSTYSGQVSVSVAESMHYNSGGSPAYHEQSGMNGSPPPYCYMNPARAGYTNESVINMSNDGSGQWQRYQGH